MFSVLMAVYHRENPQALRLALQSLEDQTCPASEIVLVQDGVLTPELDEVIEAFKNRISLRVHPLEQHGGLTRALNVGLRVATQPWILRFDSDDVCLPTRFEEQIKVIESGKVDLFGSQIEEFQTDPERPMRSRTVPCSHSEIRNFAMRRNPFNHMTVAYRRELAIGLGGYPNIPWMEDYALWALMIAQGARTLNCPQVHVRARVGAGMIDRRGGLRYVKSEMRMQQHLVNLGLKKSVSAVYDGARRSAAFLCPPALRAKVYARWLRRDLDALPSAS